MREDSAKLKFASKYRVRLDWEIKYGPIPGSAPLGTFENHDGLKSVQKSSVKFHLSKIQKKIPPYI